MLGLGHGGIIDGHVMGMETGKGCSVGGGRHWPLGQEPYHMERLESGVRYSWE